MQLKKNDKKARLLILVVSFVIFAAIVLLGRIELAVNLGFDKHIFAKANAVINSLVSILLIAGLISIKSKKRNLHKNIMLGAMLLSILFLLSYICHHLFTGDTKFGDLNHNGEIEPDELLKAGSARLIYFIILITHIFLAAIILPFILFTAYRALISEFPKHKKLARITWPIWLYVSVTGVVVYFLISPYYS
jgi:putative membrane protein